MSLLSETESKPTSMTVVGEEKESPEVHHVVEMALALLLRRRQRYYQTIRRQHSGILSRTKAAHQRALQYSLVPGRQSHSPTQLPSILTTVQKLTKHGGSLERVSKLLDEISRQISKRPSACRLVFHLNQNSFALDNASYSVRLFPFYSRARKSDPKACPRITFSLSVQGDVVEIDRGYFKVTCTELGWEQSLRAFLLRVVAEEQLSLIQRECEALSFKPQANSKAMHQDWPLFTKLESHDSHTRILLRVAEPTPEQCLLDPQIAIGPSSTSGTSVAPVFTSWNALPGKTPQLKLWRALKQA
eukprot:m.15264 g.15264  ORF g.15264 m.15264 type:complete len:302 (+) comp9628_c1_seq1:149-1054(+)